MTLKKLTTPRPFDVWHEDIGPVLWFRSPISEPPYFGSPLDLGRTMSVEIQIGVELIELPTRDVGGWPFGEEDEAHLWFVPIVGANLIQQQIDAGEAA